MQYVAVHLPSHSDNDRMSVTIMKLSAYFLPHAQCPSMQATVTTWNTSFKRFNGGCVCVGGWVHVFVRSRPKKDPTNQNGPHKIWATAARCTRREIRKRDFESPIFSLLSFHENLMHERCFSPQSQKVQCKHSGIFGFLSWPIIHNIAPVKSALRALPEEEDNGGDVGDDPKCSDRHHHHTLDHKRKVLKTPLKCLSII